MNGKDILMWFILAVHYSTTTILLTRDRLFLDLCGDLAELISAEKKSITAEKKNVWNSLNPYNRYKRILEKKKCK
jgi:hypothetical protein